MSGFGDDQEIFNRLIQRRERVVNKPVRKEMPKPLKSQKSATLDDFIGMVAKIVSRTLSKHNAEFIPDEGAVIADSAKKLEHPVILYSVISRTPKLELKPRQLENIIEDIDDKGNRRYGSTWSQRQNCLVQFDVVACDYITANEVMSTFEDIILTYAGYFKNNGVAEIIFQKYYTDRNLDRYRQTLSVRSIQYMVEIEKLITVFDTTIEDIDV